MTGFPAWRYRIGRFGRPEGKIFECAEDIPDGWVDSPAKLPKPKKADGLDAMSKNQLEAHARDSLGIELDRRKGKRALIEEIRSHET